MNTNITDKLRAGGMSRRSADGVDFIAASIGCEVAVVKAIVEVESSGSGMDVAGRVKVLFEKHKFYTHLTGAKRDAAVKAGLARKNWISPKNGGYKDQPNNEAALGFLIRAIAIDETAALKSASYGLGQVLGSNFALCGWRTVQDFVADMCASEDNHIKAILVFLVGNGLQASMRDRDFDAVARVYNGSANVAVYGEKMRDAYARMTGAAPAVKSPVRDAGLRIGSTGYRVEALQKRLNELGFPVVVDMDFGPATRRAVMSFQAEHLLEVDGVVGPMTQGTLDIAEASVPDARANASVETLRDNGSPVVKAADNQEKMGIIAAALAIFAALKEAGAIDDLKSLVTAVSGLKELGEPLEVVATFAASNWWLMAGGAGLALIFWSRKQKAALLTDYRNGRSV